MKSRKWYKPFLPYCHTPLVHRVCLRKVPRSLPCLNPPPFLCYSFAPASTPRAMVLFCLPLWSSMAGSIGFLWSRPSEKSLVFRKRGETSRPTGHLIVSVSSPEKKKKPMYYCDKWPPPHLKEYWEEELGDFCCEKNPSLLTRSKNDEEQAS